MNQGLIQSNTPKDLMGKLWPTLISSNSLMPLVCSDLMGHLRSELQCHHYMWSNFTHSGDLDPSGVSDVRNLNYFISLRGARVIRPITAAVIDDSWAPAVVPPPYDEYFRAAEATFRATSPLFFLHVTRSADASHEHPQNTFASPPKVTPPQRTDFRWGVQRTRRRTSLSAENSGRSHLNRLSERSIWPRLNHNHMRLCTPVRCKRSPPLQQCVRCPASSDHLTFR